MKAATAPIVYSKTSGSLKIGTVKAEGDKLNPKIGVAVVEFNCDGSMLLTRNDTMPHCLWLFDMETLRQSCLIHQLTTRTAIKNVKWNPKDRREFVFLSHDLDDNNVDSKTTLYLYRNEDVEMINVPGQGFVCTSVEWNSDGSSVLLMDADRFCVGYIMDLEVSVNKV